MKRFSKPGTLEMLISLGVVVGVLVVIDRFQYILTYEHSWAYWLGLLALLILIVAWHDLFYRVWKWIGGSLPAAWQAESTRTAALRLYLHFNMLLLGLFLLDRSPETILSPSNSGLYQVGLTFFVALTAAWPTLCLTDRGQRFLGAGWLEKVTIIWAAVLVSLVALELLLLSPFSRRNIFGIWSIWDWTYLNRYFAEAISTEGYLDRGGQHALEKPEGVTRILIVGDSVAYGVGVQYDETFPALMQDLAGPQIEIITETQVGANTGQEIALVEQGCQYHPDILILGVYPNDIQVVVDDPRYFTADGPDLRLYPPIAQQIEVFTRLNSDRSYNPALFVLADTAINAFFHRSPSNEFGLSEEQLESVYDSWQRAATDLAKVANSCGISHLYSVLLPTSQEENKDFERMRQLYEDAGFVSVNLMPAFQAEFGNLPVRALWGMPNDGHPNAELHRWYTEQIWDIIEPVAEGVQ